MSIAIAVTYWGGPMFGGEFGPHVILIRRAEAARLAAIVQDEIDRRDASRQPPLSPALTPAPQDYVVKVLPVQRPAHPWATSPPQEKPRETVGGFLKTCELVIAVEGHREPYRRKVLKVHDGGLYDRHAGGIDLALDVIPSLPRAEDTPVSLIGLVTTRRASSSNAEPYDPFLRGDWV